MRRWCSGGGFERALANMLAAAGVPKPELEFAFAKGRKFRFDLAWPEFLLFCEVHGGLWVQGRHVRPGGFLRDMEKHNLATALGWRGVYVSVEDVVKGRAAMIVMEVGAALGFWTLVQEGGRCYGKKG